MFSGISTLPASIVGKSATGSVITARLTSATSNPITEANTTVAYTITCSAPLPQAVTFNIAVEAGVAPSATAADFGGAFPTASVTIPAGGTSASGTFQLYDNALDDGDRNFVLRLTTNALPTVVQVTGSTVAFRIADNDVTSPCTLVLSTTSATTINEGNVGTTAINWTLTKSGTLASNVSVTIAVVPAASNGSLASDWQGGAFPSITITFATTDSVRSGTFTLLGNLMVDGDRYFSIQATTTALPATAIISPPTVAFTIKDDDISGPQRYPNGYRHRQQIQIGREYIEEGGTNVLIPVQFTSTDLKSVANGGKVESGLGWDIRFESVGGVKIAHGFQSYDAATGTVFAWMTYPSLSTDADAAFWVYFGRPSLSSPEFNNALVPGVGVTLGATATKLLEYGSKALARSASQVPELTNTPPTACPMQLTVQKNAARSIQILPRVIDPDATKPVVSSIVSAPSHGTAVITASGEIQYTPASNYVGADEFRYRIRDGADATKTSDATILITVRDGIDQWWRDQWTDGRSPYSRQLWNAGGSFLNENSQDKHVTLYINKMGGTDIIGGGAHQGGTRTTSWDLLMGGPATLGPNAVAGNSQLNLDASHLRGWWKFKQTHPRAWLGLYLVTMPSAKADNTSVSGAQFIATLREVANGDHNDKYVLMGRRIRWFIETRTVEGQRRNGHADRVILRPNWEFNQDTSLSINEFRSGYGGRHPLSYMVERGGFTGKQAAELYARAMWQFAQNIRAGYNMDYDQKVTLRIAFSPSRTQFYTPLENYVKDYPRTYDMMDMMYHPGNSWNSADNLARAKQSIDDNFSKTFSNGPHTHFEAVALARKYGYAYGCLEWSMRFENSGAWIKPVNEGVYEYAIEQWHAYLVENSDIASFSAAHSAAMITSTGANHETLNADHKAEWVGVVAKHIDLFKRR